MKIRSETKKDYEAVNQVVKQAFATAPHRDGNEQELVASLRTSSALFRDCLWSQSSTEKSSAIFC